MGYQPSAIDGWMQDNELVWLYNQAVQMESIVEVGSWKGRSTHALLTGCQGPVFSVDHFKGSPNEIQSSHKEVLTKDIFAEFWQGVGHFENLVVMRMESTMAAKYFARRSVDMVFIDGCHTPEAVRADVLAWKPVCRRLFCGHDLNMVRETLDNMDLKVRPEAGRIWSMGL